MKIVTITLNPAYDVHCYTENFQPYRENLAKIISRDAGGKGINIGRALLSVGVRAKNLVVAGNKNASDFYGMLDDEGIEYIPLVMEGRIRENITLHTNSAPETRISFSGFTANDGLIDSVEELILPLLNSDTVVTFSGRVPEGVTHGKVMSFLGRIRDRGARLVIDSHAVTREDIIDLHPWLIKPNGEEVLKYFSHSENILDIIESAKELHELGVENVMVSLGGDGAILVSDEGVFRAEAPKIDVISTVGAGDSSLAGFIAAALDGASSAECLRTAVAFGSAACMRDGTAPPLKTDVDKLKQQIEI